MVTFKLRNLACQSGGLSLLQITPENLLDMMQSITNKEIVFEIFFDRASDTDARFIPVVQWACNHVTHHINFHKLACRAWDKVAMHQLISVSINTPLTITLPSYDEQPLLPGIDLSSLGESFTIKPAYGGGGEGVVNGATTLSQVLIARQEFPAYRYLLQGSIIPTRLGPRMAWFRVIYCAGKVYPCWWDNNTHMYTHVTSNEEACYNLACQKLNAGFSMSEVQAILGHTTSKTTQRYASYTLQGLQPIIRGKVNTKFIGNLPSQHIDITGGLWLGGKDSNLPCQLNKCPIYKGLQELLSRVNTK